MSSCSFLLVVVLLLFYSSSLLLLIFVSHQISLKNITLMPYSSATTDKIRLVFPVYRTQPLIPFGVAWHTPKRPS